MFWRLFWCLKRSPYFQEILDETVLEGITNKDNFIWGAEKSRRSSKWFNCFPIQVHILYTHLQKSADLDLQFLHFDLMEFVSGCDFLWYIVLLLNSGKNFVAVWEKQCCQQNDNSQKYGSFFRRIFGILIRHLRVGNTDEDNDYDSKEPNVNLFIDS